MKSIKKSTCRSIVTRAAWQNRVTAGESAYFEFMLDVIERLQQMGQTRTAEAYRFALNSFQQFLGGKDVSLHEINSDLMLLYEAYLKQRGVSRNSSSFYMRILRATYNRAVENQLTDNRLQFKHVYTGIDKTVKRAIPLKAVKKIKHLDLSAKPALDFARDMFLFAFYTRGMSFIDMAYLKKNDLRHGILTYRRRKTGQTICIKWETCMQEIIDKHPVSRQSPYLLPILTCPDESRNQYRNMLSRTNQHLKEVALSADLPIPLTLYVARHSWASIAQSKHIPLSVISKGLGHDSEQTTQIYLASLDRSVIDKANKMILNDLQLP